MKIWTCNNHVGQWPVPTASVIVAETEEEARKLMREMLEELDLGTRREVDSFDLVELDVTIAHVVVLSDGDY